MLNNICSKLLDEWGTATIATAMVTVAAGFVYSSADEQNLRELCHEFSASNNEWVKENATINRNGCYVYTHPKGHVCNTPPIPLKP